MSLFIAVSSLSSQHALYKVRHAMVYWQAVGVMNQLALELDINSAVDNIRDVVLELLNCERVTLFLVDNQQKELRYLGCFAQAYSMQLLNTKHALIYRNRHDCCHVLLW